MKWQGNGVDLQALMEKQDSKDGLKIWAKGHPLAVFFVVAFIFSWGVWFPGMLNGLGLSELGFSHTDYTVLNVVGGFGPSLAAVILTQVSEGWGGVRSFLGRGLDAGGMSLRWWVVTLLAFPSLNLISVVADYSLTGNLPETLLPEQPLTLLLYPLAFFVPLGNHWREEYGWRGFALPLMQERYGALKTSLIIGLAWGLWHLPLFFFPTSQVVYGRIDIAAFLVKAVLLSCIMTWLYNGSGGRLFTAMVAHFMAGALDYFVVKASTPYGLTIYVAMELILVAAVLHRYGPDRMAPGAAR